MTDTPAAGRFRFTLTRQILLGLVVGCLIGWLAPSFGVSLAPIAQLFLKLIKMLIGPLLFTTLVAGVAGAGAKMVGRLGLKAILWFELATTVALFLGMAVANLVQPGQGVTLATDTSKLDKLPKLKTAWEFILDIFPDSFVNAMAGNNVLQIVAFSVFLGVAVSLAGPKAKLIKDIAEAGAEAMFKLIGIVMRFAPFGVGAAIAAALGTNGVAVLLPLLKCIAALYGALLVFFALLFAAMKLLTRVHMATFLSAIREPAAIAFTTASSDAAMPSAMQVLERLGVPRRIVSFVVPTGYAFNLDGSTLYLSLAVVFLAQAGGHDMSFGKQLGAMLLLMVASKGVAGVRGAAIVVLGSALKAFDLPGEGLVLLWGIDAVMDMGRTCVNVVGNCVATVVVAAWEKAIPPDAPIFRPRAFDVDDLPGARVVSESPAPGDSGVD